MGNQASVQQQPPPAPGASPEGAPPRIAPAPTLPLALRNFLRPPGALGLSRTELDKRCRPSGLYPSCPWDEKAIRRLVGDGRLAARLRGTELRTSPADTECPICFLHYPEVNVTKCCHASLCTECYLQVRPQRQPAAPCPFCNGSRLQVAVATALNPAAIQKRAEEEQRAIEATIRARTVAPPPPEPEPQGDTGNGSGTTVPPPTDGDTAQPPSSPPASPSSSSAFGASLAQNDRVALIRARSESFASESSAPHASSETLLQDIAALAMTPEERALLEAEVRTQQLHPLAQRLEAEQAARRLRNERDYHRTQAARLREIRARRELIGRTLGLHGSGDRRSLPPTLGGAAMSSAALRDRSARGERDWNRLVHSFGRGDVRQAGLMDDLVVLEAAIMLSMEEEEARRREQEAGRSNEDAGIDQELSTSSAQIGLSLPSDTNGTADLASHLSEVLRALQTSLHSREMNANDGSRLHAPTGDTLPDVASILLGGISEEEQIAMAIAASLNESQAPGATSSEDPGSTESTSASDTNHGHAAETAAIAPPVPAGVQDPRHSSEAGPQDGGANVSED